MFGLTRHDGDENRPKKDAWETSGRARLLRWGARVGTDGGIGTVDTMETRSLLHTKFIGVNLSGVSTWLSASLSRLLFVSPYIYIRIHIYMKKSSSIVVDIGLRASIRLGSAHSRWRKHGVVLSKRARGTAKCGWTAVSLLWGLGLAALWFHSLDGLFH